eukprot:GHVS01021514.1.p1 GENE.GHVS01021514.1~~GHVS01021514.1.p1  ORF type:complete len:232 (+),score=40.14 GHVS01021514.1:172-867(+)
MCDDRVILEWRRLLALTDVPQVAEVIQVEIIKLKDKTPPIIHISPAAPTLISSKTASPSAVTEFTTITDFAWDQTDKHVKLYVNVPEVHEVTKDNIEVSFAAQSLELKVMGPTKHYRLVVKRLSHPIKISECSHRIRKDSVAITLIKKSPSHWSDLAFKETKPGKKAPAPDDAAGGADPGASIMNLFKDLYDQGDDDMKRTIAKAWTEANDKKKAGGGGGSGGDMDFMKDE